MKRRFGRAGLLRVLDLDELFAAAETLGRVRPFLGKRLAILTNGGGIGILAVDRLVDLGGTLAGISPETMLKLDSALPPIWSRCQPRRHRRRRRSRPLCRRARGPHRGSGERCHSGHECSHRARLGAIGRATSVAAAARAYRNSVIRTKPIFAVWVGTSDAVTPIFEADGIPSYETESEAVQGFMHLVRYREAQDALMATPPSLPQDFKPDVTTARAVVANAVQRGRTWLDPIEMTRLLAAYSIPFAPALLARDADEAAATARPWLARDWAWWPKSSRPISFTNRRSAAYGSTSPTKRRSARPSPTSSRGRGPRDLMRASPA